METTKAYLCTECSFVSVDTPSPLRECSNENCGCHFASADRACPECNRPFTRTLYDMGCEECNEGEMVEAEIYGKCPKCDQLLRADETPSIEDNAVSDGGVELALCGGCDEWFLADALEVDI